MVTFAAPRAWTAGGGRARALRPGDMEGRHFLAVFAATVEAAAASRAARSRPSAREGRLIAFCVRASRSSSYAFADSAFSFAVASRGEGGRGRFWDLSTEV